MKKLLLQVFALGLVLLSASLSVSQAATNRQECIAARLVKLYSVADFLDDRAAVVESAVGGSHPAITKQIAELKGKTQGIRDNVRQAFSGSVTPETLEASLINGSVTASILNATVARINLALVPLNQPAAKQAVRDMVQKLDALRTEIPPEEPARGCK